MESAESFVLIEIASELVSVLTGIVVLLLVRQIIPSFSFLLHRRALRFIVALALFFSLAELLAFFQAVFAGESAVVSVLEDLFEVLVVLSAGLAVVVLYRSEREEVSSLRRLADVDELTSLPNRAFFRRAANRRIPLSKENHIPLSCLVFDIDDFKPYNDEFGHEAGDRALNCVARVLRDSVRADDLPARYGGEEFALLMNGGLEDAAAVAERIRSGVERRCSPQNDALIRRGITVSLGVALLARETESLEELVRSADEEMYRAKRAGKNRVCVLGDG